jgi:hypothetical protein
VTAAVLLDRLNGLKQTGPNRWVARCPAHEDRSPSLSIREVDDGRVLVRCFAGCGAIDVLESLGLNWAALFPEGGHQTAPPSQSQIPARDLLAILDHEITVAVFILDDVVNQRTVKPSQLHRLIEASARVSKARIIANPERVKNHG